MGNIIEFKPIAKSISKPLVQEIRSNPRKHYTPNDRPLVYCGDSSFRIHNISLGGIKLLMGTPQTFNQGDRLELRLSRFDKAFQPARVERVVGDLMSLSFEGSIGSNWQESFDLISAS